MRTLAIILNHNLPDLTDELYISLKQQPLEHIELMVMDNGSKPEGISKYTTVRNEINLMYGGALNLAFSLILENDIYDSMMLLNNDIQIRSENFISEMRRALGKNYAMVSPRIKGQCSWPQMYKNRAHAIRQVKWIDFVAPLFGRSFIEHVREFDPALKWGWGQDVLCGIICEDLGWKVGVVDYLCVHHLGKQTVKKGKLRVNGNTFSTEEYRSEAWTAMEDYFRKESLEDRYDMMRTWAEEY